MAKVITIPYKPREWALRLHESTKRWIVIVAHRRCGKTTAAFNHLQRDAIRNIGRYAFIAPYYKQAKNIAWDIAKQYSRPIPGVEYNEAELTIKYPNGSKITLYGADNPDALRGIGLKGCVFDEYSQQPANIFTEIIRPALADSGGYAIWIGTPKGKNEFYKLFMKSKADDEWESLLLTVDDTHILPESEVASASKTMSEDEFMQEFYCSFESSVKGAIYADELLLANKEQRIKQLSYDKALKVHTVWDLGVGLALAIGFFQKTSTEVRIIDYWEGSESDGMTDGIRVVQNRKYVYGKHFAPHDVKAREQSTGKTRWNIAQSLGIEFEIVPQVGIKHGIEQAKIMFSKLYIDNQKCQKFLENVGQYHREWDEKRGMFEEEPKHDFTSHSADVLRYSAVVEDRMTNETYKPFKQGEYIPSTDYGV